MQVKIQHRGCCVIGLHVGATNVRRYFTKQMSTIELQLDDLQIECGLMPEFWEGDGEIHDPRLIAWLELKDLQRVPGQGPMLLTMTPAGKNCFRLRVLCAAEPEKTMRTPAAAA